MAIQDQRANGATLMPPALGPGACRGAGARRMTLKLQPATAPPRRASGRRSLTAVEGEVLQGLAAGLSEREIALRLMLFESAVRAALRSICRKLHVQNRVDAVARAVTHGEGV